MSQRTLVTTFDDDEPARVDALARLYHTTRDAMIARLFRTGLLVTEHRAREARERDEKKKGGAG